MESLNVSNKYIDILGQIISSMESLTRESTIFPSDVLKWMKINAKPLMAVKLMKLCKYFQHQKFPFFVVKDIICRGGRLTYYTLDKASNECATFDELPENLWITTSIDTNLIPHDHVITRIIPKIAICEINSLVFMDEDISFNDFKVLTSSGNITFLSLYKLDIIDDGQVVPLEDLLACVPIVRKLYLHSSCKKFTSSEAATKCILPHLRKFCYAPYKNDFNVKGFIEFMKIHKTVKFDLEIEYPLGFVSLYLLQTFVDELTQAADLRYPPPVISFDGQSEDSFMALHKLRNEFYKKKNKGVRIYVAC